MRLPRPRFTIRRPMAAVLAVGLLLPLAARPVQLRWRAGFHRRLAHAGAATAGVTRADGTAGTLYRPTEDGWWHYMRSVQLEEAASRPWLLSDPAPPPRKMRFPAGAGFFD